MGQKERSDKVHLSLNVQQVYQTESRRFVLWLPVFLGLGIWAYFALPSEPDWAWSLLALPPLILVISGRARRAGWLALAMAWMALTVMTGFAAAVWSAHRVDAPMISFPLGETVEGRVIGTSRSAAGKPRLLLDQLVIFGLEASTTPRRIRLTVLDPPPDGLPSPGERIRVYATLMPVGEPVEPGAFDFRRRAFFDGLGGIGLIRGAILQVPAVETTTLADHFRITLAKLRADLSAALRAPLPERQGAFAAAIIVGDRAAIEEEDAEALRASNLAHLLAISGLHMGILTGLVFAAMRILLALHPGIALRWPTKKVAAVIALTVGACYLGLSGATIATQRAFIMVAVMFCAILVNRPAISLRGLALAAVIVLMIRPISLLDAGFQMSFAATAALIAAYEAVREWSALQGKREGSGSGIAHRLLRGAAVYVAALLFTSLIAGLATAPFAAYHFNRTAPYGLIANLFAVPVMGLWIAPSACIAAILAPFGLSDVALKAMGQGIEQVLVIAHWVAGMPGAVKPVAAGSPLVLSLIVIGGLWLILWRGRLRLFGLGPVLAGLLVWTSPPARPDILIGSGAQLVGVMGAEGRVLDRYKTQSFAAKSWLRRDGDLSMQAEAADRPGLRREGRDVHAELANGWILRFNPSRKTTPEELRALCLPRTLLVAAYGPAIEGPCRYFGERNLRQTGAIAIYQDGEDLRIRTVHSPARRRLWSPR